MSNTKSLPHESINNGKHVDVYSYQEGKIEPQKFHIPINNVPQDPRSVEALRERLKIEKGY